MLSLVLPWPLEDLAETQPVPGTLGAVLTRQSGTGAWRDFALDPETGDLLIVGGDFVLVQGIEAIAQECRIALATFRGEFAFNTEVGCDWQTLLNNKRTTDGDIQAEVRRALLTVSGVQSVDSVTVTRNPTTRGAAITADVRTDTGAVLTIEAAT